MIVIREGLCQCYEPVTASYSGSAYCGRCMRALRWAKGGAWVPPERHTVDIDRETMHVQDEVFLHEADKFQRRAALLMWAALIVVVSGYVVWRYIGMHS